MGTPLDCPHDLTGEEVVYRDGELGSGEIVGPPRIDGPQPVGHTALPATEAAEVGGVRGFEIDEQEAFVGGEVPRERPAELGLDASHEGLERLEICGDPVHLIPHNR